jgi:hypothetical protein
MQAMALADVVRDQPKDAPLEKRRLLWAAP